MNKETLLLIFRKEWPIKRTWNRIFSVGVLDAGLKRVSRELGFDSCEILHVVSEQMYIIKVKRGTLAHQFAITQDFLEGVDAAYLEKQLVDISRYFDRIEYKPYILPTIANSSETW